MLAPHVVMLHQDETVGIIFAGAELNIAPLQRNKFTAAQARTQGSQEEWIILRADIIDGFQKLSDFLLDEANTFDIGRFGGAGKTPESRRRV